MSNHTQQEAKQKARFGEPQTPPNSFWGHIRQFIFGKPIETQHAQHSLLPKILALPIFASDAISSVAYATQQIILVLGAAGLYAHYELYQKYTLAITGIIVALLIIVVMSYWQTIFAYPTGGGSYIVARENLGTIPSLVAGAALLIDYVLTVAVSIAAGVQNLSEIPLPSSLEWLHFKNLVPWAVFFVVLLTYANLRGLKESGLLFAIPTYGFVFMCYLLIFLGFMGPSFGWEVHQEFVHQQWAGKIGHSFQTAGIVVLLSAFANGCSAMTGTEAVCDGIPAFQEPKSRNAALTLVMMGVILGTIFLGISGVAMKLHVIYDGHCPPVIDQISGAIFGKEGKWAFAYYLTQTATAAILILAANTAYADFPRLASILANDKYLPKQLANLGDKLVFNNGIVILGIFASILIWAKQGNVDSLIPLYAVGVFTAFTLSQSAKVVRWFKLKEPHWQRKALLNGIGAFFTFLVLLDIAIEKFHEGAYWILLVGAFLIWMFLGINKHYEEVKKQLKIEDLAKQPIEPDKVKNTVVVFVPSVHQGVHRAIEYALAISGSTCHAVCVDMDATKTQETKDHWKKWADKDISLVILPAPERSLIKPIVHYIDAVQDQHPDDIVTVIVPKFIPTKPWHYLLHGNNSILIHAALWNRDKVVIVDVGYHLDETKRL